MKVIIENHIPYIKGLIEPFADVEYLAPESFTPESVRSADALIIRTRTKCDDALLHDSQCQFIGTATIGTDHINLPYCESRGIKVCNAAGCNAPAVAQYVFATIAKHMEAKGLSNPADITLGIVGVGHIGKIVQRFATECGFKVLLCDPIRAINEGSDAFVTLDDIAANAHIITFHTPHTKDGEYPTHHLCNANFLSKLSQCSLLINSARGPIVDTPALVAHLESSSLEVAIDCWENEPYIDAYLLNKAFVATPHIAGYSAEGKMRGTAMVIEQLNSHFGWNITPQNVAACTPTLGAENVSLQFIAESYNPLQDTAALKATNSGIISGPVADVTATQFEHQRNHYSLRHEVESR